jgi:hypothetical protein
MSEYRSCCKQLKKFRLDSNIKNFLNLFVRLLFKIKNRINKPGKLCDGKNRQTAFPRLNKSIKAEMACFCSRSNFLYKLAMIETNAFSNSHESSKNISIFNHVIWRIVRLGRLEYLTLSPSRSVHATSTAYSSSLDKHLNIIYLGLSRLTHLS